MKTESDLCLEGGFSHPLAPRSDALKWEPSRLQTCLSSWEALRQSSSFLAVTINYSSSLLMQSQVGGADPDSVALLAGDTFSCPQRFTCPKLRTLIYLSGLFGTTKGKLDDTKLEYTKQLDRFRNTKHKQFPFSPRFTASTDPLWEGSRTGQEWNNGSARQVHISNTVIYHWTNLDACEKIKVFACPDFRIWPKLLFLRIPEALSLQESWADPPLNQPLMQSQKSWGMHVYLQLTS